MKRTSKVIPAIKSPGSDKMPTGGTHNPNIGIHAGSGKLASVKPAGAAPAAGSFLPMQNNAMAGMRGPKLGQGQINTSAVATQKPKRKGGAAFYGEM